MMLQLKDKKNKLLLYVLVIIFLSTINNKFSNNKKILIPKINNIKVFGLSETNNSRITSKLSRLLYKNIFFLEKKNLINILSKNNLIESFNIKKIYPNLIEVHLEKTNFIAVINDNNQNFFIGSNGKLIDYESSAQKLPFVFGKIDYENFLNFKDIIDKSKFSFKEIHSIYFFQSNRWDIKTHDGLLIKLPEKNLFNALETANKITNNDQLKTNKIIDLRILNHMIVSK